MLTVLLQLRTRSLNGSHGHWAARAKAKANQRQVAALCTRKAAQAVGLPASVTMTRIAPSNGLDFDNLVGSLKSCRDGIADAFELDDDNDPRIRFEYAQERGKVHGVRVSLARMDQDATLDSGQLMARPLAKARS